MGSVWKSCVVAVVLCDLSTFGWGYPSEPNRGFQFNCGPALCTFPNQYCDTDDYRCLYCSDDLCHSSDLPDQCITYCKDIIQGPSTPTREALRNLTGEYLEETMQENLATPLWLIVIVLVVILLFLIGFLIYFCCSKYNQCPSRTPFITNPCDDNHNTYNQTFLSKPVTSLHTESERKSLLDKTESFDSGNSSIEGTMASSTSTASSVTHPQEVGESRQHERHIEHELLKNSLPESSRKESVTSLTNRDTSVRPPNSNSLPTFQPDTFSSNVEDTCLKSNS